MNHLDRRSFLSMSALLATVPRISWGGTVDQVAPVKLATPSRLADHRRVMRVAHLSDIHVQPERGADAGMAMCFDRAQRLDPKPDLILTGGDGVMDVFAANQARATELRKMFTTGLTSHCAVPVHHAIGNHDIYGWNKRESGATGQEPDWGKKYACQMYGLSNRFYSFDMNGWHFVVLDSVQPLGEGYVAYCDEEQSSWLANDLKSRPTGSPVLVLSHVPILSVTSLANAQARNINDRSKDTTISAGRMHTDGAALHRLFQSSDVKVCLSGHMHLLDRCTTDGVTYICDGAVSGAWWKGPNHGVPEGFGVIDLFADGSFEHQYVTYGWTARASLGEHLSDFIGG